MLVATSAGLHVPQSRRCAAAWSRTPPLDRALPTQSTAHPKPCRLKAQPTHSTGDTPQQGTRAFNGLDLPATSIGRLGAAARRAAGGTGRGALCIRLDSRPGAWLRRAVVARAGRVPP